MKPDVIRPIADESLANRAIELFLSGYEPLLYAANLGLTPEQVWDQIRVTLKIYVEKSLAAEQKLNRKGKSGRRPEGARAMTPTERSRRSREKKKAAPPPVRSSDDDPNDRNGQPWMPVNPYNK